MYSPDRLLVGGPYNRYSTVPLYCQAEVLGMQR
eukprot:COSAG05_NODE_6498_length_946_cov_3.072019_1_plen_32_part_10